MTELFFNSEGKWTIELKFLDDRFLSTYDIYISSSSGMAKVKSLNDIAIYKTKILTITNDSLESNLTINPLGDSINVFRPGANQIFVPLVFGNRVTSEVRAPQKKESIAIFGSDYNKFLDLDYSIDMSPSIGKENDTTGMCGTIKGKIYDPKNLLPTNSFLQANGMIPFKPDANGNFNAKICSSKKKIDKLYYFSIKSGIASGYYVKVTPVVVTTEPNQLVNVDLNVYDIVSSVENLKYNQESIFKISPNPIKDYSFNYEIAIPVKSANSYLEIFNISGQKVGRFSISENTGKINLQNSLQDGTYTVRLFVNNKNYTNSKIIIAH